MSWMRSGIKLSQFLRFFLPTFALHSDSKPARGGNISNCKRVLHCILLYIFTPVVYLLLSLSNRPDMTEILLKRA